MRCDARVDEVLEHFEEETGSKRNGTIIVRKRRVPTLENRDDDAAFPERGDHTPRENEVEENEDSVLPTQVIGQHTGSVRDGALTQRKVHSKSPTSSSQAKWTSRNRTSAKKSSSKESGESPTEAKMISPIVQQTTCLALIDHRVIPLGHGKCDESLIGAENGRERCAERSVRWNARRAARNRACNQGEGLR